MTLLRISANSLCSLKAPVYGKGVNALCASGNDNRMVCGIIKKRINMHPVSVVIRQGGSVFI